MSKMGAYNLELQEKANELGFETPAQAISAGWSENSLARLRLADIADEREKAHNAWLKDRAKIIDGLRSVRKAGAPWMEDVIDQAIAFILRGEE